MTTQYEFQLLTPVKYGEEAAVIGSAAALADDDE
jgi:hypothetical protein